MVFDSPEHQAKHQQAYDHAKASTDGSMGAVSFSGADIKAVVYMPIDFEQAKLEKENLQLELAELQRSWEYMYDLSASLQQQIEDIIDDIVRMRSEQALHTTGSPGWIAYEDQINRTLVKENDLRRDLKAARFKFPPDALQSIKDQIKVTQAAIEQLEKFKAGDKTGIGVKPLVLGDLQTITYSSHREKFPVRTLGRVYPKSYTRGPRTIAGTLIFTVINKHALWDLIQWDTEFRNTGVRGSEDHWGSYSTSTVDQLAPFDITLLFSNEYGDNSYMVLYGVEIVNEGQTMSIQDLLTENTMQFVCRDLDPLRPVHEKRRILAPGAPLLTAEDLVRRTLTNAATRRSKRFNPFI